MKSIITSIIVIVLILLGLAFIWNKPVSDSTLLNQLGMHASSTDTQGTSSNMPSVTYFCSEGTFTAKYQTNAVVLTVASKDMTLPQVQSGSGIRYENGTFTLIGKGNNATLMSGSKTLYSNCVGGNVSASGAGTGLRAFEDANHTFSFVYPDSWMVSGGEAGFTQSWRFNTTNTGILLVKVVAPKSYMPGTNFSEATFTIGASSDPQAIKECTIATNGEKAAGKAMVNGITFSKFTLGGAGAGNFYDTTSYRALYDGDCYALEYTIHSTNIGNYDPSQGIKEFDKIKVQTALENIVQSTNLSLGLE